MWRCACACACACACLPLIDLTLVAPLPGLAGGLEPHPPVCACDSSAESTTRARQAPSMKREDAMMLVVGVWMGSAECTCV